MTRTLSSTQPTQPMLLGALPHAQIKPVAETVSSIAWSVSPVQCEAYDANRRFDGRGVANLAKHTPGGREVLTLT